MNHNPINVSSRRSFLKAAAFLASVALIDYSRLLGAPTRRLGPLHRETFSNISMDTEDSRFDNPLIYLHREDGTRVCFEIISGDDAEAAKLSAYPTVTRCTAHVTQIYRIDGRRRIEMESMNIEMIEVLKDMTKPPVVLASWREFIT